MINSKKQFIEMCHFRFWCEAQEVFPVFFPDKEHKLHIGHQSTSRCHYVNQRFKGAQHVVGHSRARLYLANDQWKYQ